MYITDADLVEFFTRAKPHLTNSEELTAQGKSGLIFVKENVNAGKFLIDREDNSIMRTEEHFRALFEEAGYQILKQFYQKGFPKDLYDISCYVIRAKPEPQTPKI